jgi:hypothetical protein
MLIVTRSISCQKQSGWVQFKLAAIVGSTEDAIHFS